MATVPIPTNMLEQIQQRVLEIKNGTPARIDEQEMREREDAAQAYFGEDEKHYCDYASECVKTSRAGMSNIRMMQRECWSVYQEEEPPTYANKEDWQSRVIIPKPHSAVQFARTQVRKAFTPEFLSIQNEPNQLAGDFWEAMMQRQLSETHANFAIRFPDATEMGLVIGTSMEMIPQWDAQKGLQYSLVEPWKIHRDPDALSRESQSGMYWIHEEFQDLWTLLKGEEDGQYINVRAAKSTLESATNTQNPEMDPGRQAELKKQLLQRNSYRKMALVREFWGVIVDRRGEMLLPRHTYTVAGNKVISIGERRGPDGEPMAGPMPSPYPTLRWPGVAFSPLPHLLRFDGRGIVQGIRSLWYWMCSLMALHSDNLNWTVNPMTEVNIQALVDQSDIDTFPGKVYAVKDTISGQQVVRTIDHSSRTNDVLANLAYADKGIQEGTFVTSNVQGLPGYRSEITAREWAGQLDQSMSMFATLGINIHNGALDAIRAGMETCMVWMTMKDVQKVFGPERMEELTAKFQQASDGFPAPMMGGLPLPLLEGTFSVSGLTSVMKDVEVIKAINEVVIPMSVHPVYSRYIIPPNVIASIEKRLNLKDEKLFITGDAATQMVEEQKQQDAEMQQMQMQLMQAQQAAEQEKLRLEAQKLELETIKMANELRIAEIESEIAMVESDTERERLVAEQAALQQNLQKQAADIRKTEIEIGAMILKMREIEDGMRIDQEKLNLQARQSEAQLQVQRDQLEQQKEIAVMAQRSKANGNSA